MKKVFILIMVLFLISGCENIKNVDIEEIINTVKIEENRSNVYRVGFKYYLPQGLKVESSSLYNEILTNNKYNFYLFVDMVSYYNQNDNLYEENSDAYYSKNIEINDKFGYLEINKKENNEYLIEIMYNYAKIEVMVDYEDINESLIYSFNLLKSMEYNDIVIETLIGEEVLNFSEEDYNIFNTNKNDSTYLNYDNTYEEPEKEYDQDLIN